MRQSHVSILQNAQGTVITTQSFDRNTISYGLICKQHSVQLGDAKSCLTEINIPIGPTVGHPWAAKSSRTAWMRILVFRITYADENCSETFYRTIFLWVMTCGTSNFVMQFAAVSQLHGSAKEGGRVDGRACQAVLHVLL